MIRGLRWYRRMVPKKGKSGALFDQYTEDELRQALIISYNPEPEVRFYYPFFDPEDFDNYQYKFPDEERCFHEVILWQQKPHFDLDISLDKDEETLGAIGQRMLDVTITAIINACKEELNLILRVPEDFLVFTSHGIGKRSYHLIIPTYHCNDSIEYGVLYDLVSSRLSSTFRGYLDKGTCSSKHNLRILGSTKAEEERPKLWSATYYYQGKEYQSIGSEEQILRLSLVSYIKGTKDIPALRALAAKREKRRRPQIEIPAGVAAHAISLLRQHYSDDCLEVREVSGSYIPLDHLQPYHCIVCRKAEPHENENPFLNVNEDGDIYFWCRRARKGLKLGSSNLSIENKGLEYVEAENSEGEFFLDFDDESPPSVKVNPPQKEVKSGSLLLKPGSTGFAESRQLKPEIAPPSHLSSLITMSKSKKEERQVQPLFIAAFSSQLH